MDVSTLSTLIVFLYWFSSNVDGNYALFLAICRYRSLVAKVNYQVDKGIWDKIKVIYFNNRHVMEIGIANSIYGVVYFCFDQLIVLYHVNINVEIDRDIISWDWITLVCLMFTVTWTESHCLSSSIADFVRTWMLLLHLLFALCFCMIYTFEWVFLFLHQHVVKLVQS